MSISSVSFIAGFLCQRNLYKLLVSSYWVAFLLQKSLKKEHFLWQIYNIEKDIDKINEEVEAEKESRQKLVEEQNDYEHEKREKEKELAKYQKEINKLERKITEKNSKLDKNVSFLVSKASIH